MTQHDSFPEEMHSPAPELSRRAREAKKNEAPGMDQIFAKVFGDQYAPETPDGLLNLGVAENSLMADWLLEHYHKLDLTLTDLTYGNALAGSQRLFEALSNLFDTHFHAIKKVTSKHMVCGVGVSAVLDQLCDKIADAGDGILIATPYYNGFDNDLGARSLVKPVAVNFPADVEPSSPKTLEYFEAKINELKRTGETPIKAMIMCNPNNPLGFIYQRETILAYCRFAEKHNIHLIVDEIYALSLYKNRNFSTPAEFTSVLSMDVKKEAGCTPARVHVLYGMSKDFGSNGLRVGVLVSQHNPDLIKSFGVSAILMKVSSPADVLWTSIIGDQKVLGPYLEEAQTRAGDTLAFTFDWLEKLNISHSNPVAGHFIWCDVRAYLPKFDKHGKKIDDPAKQEFELFMRLLNDGNVYVAPGAFYHSQIPGFFRLTFTVRREYLKVGCARVEKIFRQVQKENEDLMSNMKSLQL